MTWPSYFSHNSSIHKDWDTNTTFLSKSLYSQYVTDSLSAVLRKERKQVSMAGALPAEAVTQILRVCETGDRKRLRERDRQRPRKRSMYFQIYKAPHSYPKQKLQEAFRHLHKNLFFSFFLFLSCIFLSLYIRKGTNKSDLFININTDLKQVYRNIA